MAGMVVGYARSSTVDQVAGFEAQKRELAAAGCEKIFAEQVSSVAERRELKACLSFLREGDSLVVTRPDRLARSTSDLLTVEADLRARRIGLVVMSMGLDTRRNGSDPTTRLQLTILAAVAQFERELMLERQREGIAKATSEGKYRGRAPTVRRQAATIKAMRAEGKSPTTIARELKVARSSVYLALSA